MFSPEELEKAKKLIQQLSALNSEPEYRHKKNNPYQNKKKNPKNSRKTNRNENHNENNNTSKSCINLIPSKLIVIAGFLSGVLEVNSVLVSRDQEVQIVLTGSLKQQTQLDQVMEQIGKLPFDQVIKSIIEGADS